MLLNELIAGKILNNQPFTRYQSFYCLIILTMFTLSSDVMRTK